ncbi:MAG: ABC transporter ATP-binding protein [Halomonas sp.]|uniref:ABC transporter ATP-binding protein n=1 Tax=Halomonas sp. TaxID=1486246 RepID=UPI002870ACE0|nr:ABC transporter ATP-binding protein [Halomonas sp.]MDR9439178.1 ABC transporter ATP-binding protein [Halomonas sp.]
MKVDVTGLSSGYGRITILRDLNLQVADGQITAVLGRNGMGKSTLIHTLAGLLPATQGTIRLNGKDMTRASVRDRARAGVTTVVQGRGIFPRLTVRENLIMGRVASGRAQRDRTDEVVAYFPRLGERMSQLAGTMSGGEQQMLAIGRGLMTDPTLMLLDEPSDGIMPKLVTQIAETLVRINQEQSMTVIIVEQNVPMVFRMASHFMVMENGQSVFEADTADVDMEDIMHRYLAI